MTPAMSCATGAFQAMFKAVDELEPLLAQMSDGQLIKL